MWEATHLENTLVGTQSTLTDKWEEYEVMAGEVPNLLYNEGESESVCANEESGVDVDLEWDDDEDDENLVDDMVELMDKLGL